MMMKKFLSTTVQIQRCSAMRQCFASAQTQVRFLSSHQNIDKKRVVEQFLEDKEVHGENYLGIRVVEDDFYMSKKLEKVVKHAVDSYLLSDNIPQKLSSSYDSLYSRMSHSYDFIVSRDWITGFADAEGYEMYDDWQVTSKQFEKRRNDMSKQDLQILEPLYNRMNTAWNMAMKAEQMGSLLQDMLDKYQNTYAFPQNDFKTLCMIVDDYLLALEKKDKLSSKYTYKIGQALIYLKQRILLPELTVKYPEIFK